MILICERCDARYTVSDERLGNSGRTVRCSSCGHTWRHLPEPAAIAVTDAVPATDESFPGPEPAIEEPPAVEPAQALKAFRGRRPAAPTVEAGAGRRKALRTAALAGPSAALLLALIAARGPLVELWPPAAKFYAFIGIPVSDPGLAVRAVQMKEHVDNGHRVVAIEGEIANVSAESQSVPSLHAALRRNDKVVLRWSFKPGPEMLEAGQAIPFRTELADAPEGAQSVSVGLWRH